MLLQHQFGINAFKEKRMSFKWAGEGEAAVKHIPSGAFGLEQDVAWLHVKSALTNSILSNVGDSAA